MKLTEIDKCKEVGRAIQTNINLHRNTKRDEHKNTGRHKLINEQRNE